MIHVGVFGAQGYLGRELVNLLKSNKIPYSELIRESKLIPEPDLGRITLLIDCGFPPDYAKPQVAKGYLSEMEFRTNLAKTAGIDYLYLGSFSSSNGGFSKYGEIKQMAEKIVSSKSLTNVKVGLVVDDYKHGGRIKDLTRIIRWLPILPTPHPRWFPVNVTELFEFKRWMLSFITDHILDPPMKSEVIPLANLLRRYSNGKPLMGLSSPFTFILIVVIKFFPLRLIDGLKSIAIKFPE